jgi:hypothetical protein
VLRSALDHGGAAGGVELERCREGFGRIVGVRHGAVRQARRRRCGRRAAGCSVPGSASGRTCAKSSGGRFAGAFHDSARRRRAGADRRCGDRPPDPAPAQGRGTGTEAASIERRNSAIFARSAALLSTSTPPVSGAAMGDVGEHLVERQRDAVVEQLALEREPREQASAARSRRPERRRGVVAHLVEEAAVERADIAELAEDLAVGDLAGDGRRSVAQTRARPLVAAVALLAGWR